MSFDHPFTIWFLLSFTVACLGVTFIAQKSWPPRFLALLAFLHSACFIVTGVFAFVPTAVSHWWHFRQGIGPEAIGVTAVYTAQAFIAALVAVLHEPIAKRSRLWGPGLTWANQTRASITSNRGRSDDNRMLTADSNTQINADGDSKLAAIHPARLPQTFLLALSCMTVGLIGLAIWHAARVKWGLLYSHPIYLLARDPVEAGLNNLPLEVFHRSVTKIGVLTLVLGCFLSRRDRLLRDGLFVVAGYGFLMAVCFNSRLAAGYPAILLMFASSYKRDWPRLITKVLLSVLTATIFLLMITARMGGSVEGELRTGKFGLQRVCEAFVSLEFISTDAFVIFFFTLFGSGYQLQAAIQEMGSVQFETSFKLAAYSPFPSFIDGYSRLAESNQLKPFSGAPYSSFAESLLFGPFWTGLFFLLLAVTTLSTTIVCQRYRGHLVTAVFVVFCAGLVYLESYPIRMSARFLYLCLILSLLASRYSQRT